MIMFMLLVAFLVQLVFDMKKELYEIAKCIPWIKQKLDENPKGGWS